MKIQKILLFSVFGLSVQLVAHADEVRVLEVKSKVYPEVIVKPVHRSDLRAFSVTVNPGSFLNGEYGAEMAFRISERVALTVGGSGHYYGVLTFPLSSPVAPWGGSGSLGAKFFLSDTAFKSGVYIKPMIIAGYYDLDAHQPLSLLNPFSGMNADVKMSSFFNAVTALFGYGIVTDSGFTLNVGMGPMLAGRKFTETKTGKEGVALAMSLNLEGSIGYSW